MRPNKRDELVRNAKAIFYRNGFHATGMDMIVAETGISKTSMYKHFRTKDDLILATLRLRDEEFRNWLFRRMAEQDATPREQLLAMFDALGEWFDQPDFRGCMFIKASSEYQEAENAIHAQCTEHKRLLFDQLRDIAKAAGAVDPATLAQHLLLLKEGAIVTAHLGNRSGTIQNAKTAASALIEAALQSKA